MELLNRDHRIGIALYHGQDSVLQQDISQLSSSTLLRRHLVPNSASVAALPSVSLPSAELFVGNLSFFCTETHLFDLFNSYGHCIDARIATTDIGNKPMMFGFVTLSSIEESSELRSLLNNHLFMGRRLKIEYSDGNEMGSIVPSSRTTSESEDGVQVHVSFRSSFSRGEIVLPSESFFRKELGVFGYIVDAVVKQYNSHPTSQGGYGFVIFADHAAAVAAIQRRTIVTSQGIQLTCEGSRRSGYFQVRQSRKKNRSGRGTTGGGDPSMMGSTDAYRLPHATVKSPAAAQSNTVVHPQPHFQSSRAPYSTASMTLSSTQSPVETQGIGQSIPVAYNAVPHPNAFLHSSSFLVEPIESSLLTGSPSLWNSF